MKIEEMSFLRCREKDVGLWRIFDCKQRYVTWGCVKVSPILHFQSVLCLQSAKISSARRNGWACGVWLDNGIAARQWVRPSPLCILITFTDSIYSPILQWEPQRPRLTIHLSQGKHWSKMWPVVDPSFRSRRIYGSKCHPFRFSWDNSPLLVIFAHSGWFIDHR